jgi:photosystem II stability/assembly factor-like uncharacterized protein
LHSISFGLLLGFIFFLSVYAYSQSTLTWEIVPSPVTQNLNCISPLDNNHIVGDNGTVLKYDGTNWISLSGYPNVNYYGLTNTFGTNSPYFTVVGSGGTIIATQDNFVNWNQEPSGISNNLYSVSSASTNLPVAFKRIAVGAGGVILKSHWLNNVNWSPWSIVNSPVTQDLKSVCLWSTYGWICGNNGTLLKSTDMGESWNQISIGMSQNLNSIYFASDTTGFLVGDLGLLLKTTNGGLNWNPQTAGITVNLKSIAGNFIAGSSGNIIQSTNNGMSWMRFYQTYQYDLNSVNNVGYIAGNSGTILRRVVTYSYSDKILNVNNISSFFNPTGIFDQNIRSGNLAGFEWPKGSGKTAIFTAGLCIAGKINGQLREAMASYKGELKPGAIINGNPYTTDAFKLYSVKRTDNWETNPDWYNWGYMVPFGAPFIDVNNNGTYEYGIDIPGVPGAAQTIFACLTDGFDSSHTSSEGFGGGTPPLKTEVHLIAWAYSNPALANIQFLKYDVINKNSQPWNNSYFTLFSDPDLGWANDDFIGCDTIRNLGYVYNGTNNDQMYGSAPPAAGFLLLKGARNKYSFPPINLSMTSFGTMTCISCNPPECESDPNGEPYAAYLMMKGYKKDSTRWMDVSQVPPKKTFYIYSGDPETNNGWTEPKGHMNNCGGDTTGTIIVPNAPGDRRLIMSSGAENLTVAPGDTQTIIIAQLIARGNSNKNSVTKLKYLSDLAANFYENNYSGHSVSGTIRYFDNNLPVTNGGYVKALKLDKLTGQILILDSTGILPDGTYTLPSVPLDSVDIGVYPNSGSTPDFVHGYYPATINWQQATVIYPVVNLNNINISVFRVTGSSTTNSINGRVFQYSNGGIKDAYLYAKVGNNFVNFTSTGDPGIYHLMSLPSGNLKIIVHRMGYTSDSSIFNLINTLDSINFYLTSLYVGIKNVGGVIPERFNLLQNYPNPFNPVTKIKFEIPQNVVTLGVNKLITLKVFDILGKEITTLINEQLQPGVYEVEFNGSNLPSGVYFYRLLAGDYMAVKKMLLIK